MSRKCCRECGSPITDRNDGPGASSLCRACRARRSPSVRIPGLYGPHVSAYLDEHGWPRFTNAKRLLELYPDILDRFEIRTSRYRLMILYVCLQVVIGIQGHHYVPRNQSSTRILTFALVDPADTQTQEGVTA